MKGRPIFDRRSLLLAGFSAAVPIAAAPPRLETLTDWLHADGKARQLGLQSSLDRIRQMDGSIHAWVQVSPQKQAGDGPLAGIPYGAKDIMETRGLATEYGSPVYKGRMGTTDAAIVQDLRRRGAILMGKTQTTAFAYRDPAPTRNPRNLEHTPGGSSSGSAAAVAAAMVPFALGTQTRGSVLRPASYCGVTGFKPTHGLIPLDGVLPFAHSLDTLGFFTHTPADMILLWNALGHDTGSEEKLTLAAPDPMPAVEPEMTAAVQKAISALRKAGVGIQSIDISPLLDRVDAAADIVMFYEGAQFHQQRFKEFGDRLGAMAALVRQGRQIPSARYDEARQHIAEGGARMLEIYKTTPVILVPATTGPAPLGLSFTGDPKMNSPWTALGTPAISIPMPVGNALPLGLQLTAAPRDEARLLQTAAQVYRILHANA